MDEQNNDGARQPDLRILAIGAVAGLIAAGFGMLQRTPAHDVLSDNMLARVNDISISRDDYAQAVARRSGAPQNIADEEFLQQLIDEELLVQRGLELGMVQSDLTVRQAVIDSLIASVTAEADAVNPTDDMLTVYLAANPERFSTIANIELDAWQSNSESAAQAFIQALRDDDDATPGENVERMPDLPTGLIPMDIAVDYVGPGIAAAAANMPEGSSAVFARRGRWLIVRLRSREESAITNLEPIRNRVLLDYRRHVADESLRSYIDGLRQRADIVTRTQ